MNWMALPFVFITSATITHNLTRGNILSASATGFELAREEKIHYNKCSQDFTVLYMKSPFLIPVILATMCHAQELTVETSVLNYRRSYRVPTIEGTSRMTLALGFTPPPGYVVREQAEFNGQIKGTDAGGRNITCNSSALCIDDEKKGSAKLELALTPHPKGEWLRLQGNAKLTLASGIKLRPHHKLSLTEKTEFTLDGIPFTATPAAGNTAKSNIEKGQLSMAELTLSYPESVTIMHICRIWQDESIHGSPVHRQELHTTSEKGKDGKTHLHITLWDTRQQETIEMVTCDKSHHINVPIDLHLNLGGVMSQTPTQTEKK